MRLGGFYSPKDIDDLDRVVPALDRYGLSTIQPPAGFEENMTDHECIEFGKKARSLGLVVGEAGMWENLMTNQAPELEKRIKRLTKMLKKGDLMGCKCVVILVGSRDRSEHAMAMDPFMFTDGCKKEYRELLRFIVEGLDLKTTRLAVEPWHNSFFYQPEDIKTFLDGVDRSSVGLHLDMTNIISPRDYFNTTDLINRTFDLLADRIVSVHLKDLRCDDTYMGIKYDEVLIGEGVQDYKTLLTRLAQLPADTPCFCEHLREEFDYIINFKTLQDLAKEAGVEFLKRTV